MHNRIIAWCGVGVIITSTMMAGCASPSKPVDAGAAAREAVHAGSPGGIHPGSPQNAETYYQWLLGCLDAIEADLPRIAAAADAAAKLYVENEAIGISSIGDEGFRSEALGRSGGMMGFGFLNPKKKDVLLFAPREGRFEEDLATAAECRKQNSFVIIFARKSIIEAAKQAGAVFDFELENHAAEHGGLFPSPDGKGWLVPTDTTANAALLWVWTGEFAASCTRRGKMPAMYLGFAVPDGFDRAKRLRGLRFHPETPQPVPPLQLGREFLRELRRDLARLRSKEMSRIRAVARLAVDTRAAGRKACIFAHGHSFMTHIAIPHDPGYFTQINANWFKLKEGVALQPGDFVLCLGFNVLFRGKQFDYFDENARQAGAKLAWCITSYIKEEVKAIPRGEILIDQHWAFGDAVVAVPGYDIKILPTSGVLGEAALWMLNAEICGLSQTGR